MNPDEKKLLEDKIIESINSGEMPSKELASKYRELMQKPKRPSC